MAPFRMKARWKRRPRKVGMNGTERAYAEHLGTRGDVVAFLFESIKLRLADKTFYTPDFCVMLEDGTIEFHEVKGGFFEDDARVKIKVAAEQYPWFTFRCFSRRRVKDPWKEEVFGVEDEKGPANEKGLFA